MGLSDNMAIAELPAEKVPYDLLLLADESREAVEDYLWRGKCYGALYGEIVVGEYVLIRTRPFTAEIVNFAVAPDWQGRGVGTRLLGHAVETARRVGFRKLEIGTADTSVRQLALYERFGFRREWVDKDFFLLHYNKPVYENGELCRDMVRLGMLL